MSASDYLADRESSKGDESLAKYLGITYDELIDNQPEITRNESKDGMLYGFIVTFPDTTPQYILDKIQGRDGYDVSIPPNIYDGPDDDE